MASASLNITVTPRRMLRKSEAALHCGLPVKVFERMCPARPLALADGYDRYYIRDLDSWIDGLKGGLPSETDDAILERLA